MKFHLPLGLLKVLLAVVCLPATTIAADAVPNEYTQPIAADSQAVFGEGDDLDKSVEIAPEGMSASTVEITGSDYQFSGGDMVVTERVSAEKSATMNNVLTCSLTTVNSISLKLSF